MKHQYRFRWRYGKYRNGKRIETKAVKPSRYFKELAKEGAGWNVGRSTSK